MRCPKCRDLDLLRADWSASEGRWTLGPRQCPGCGGHWIEGKLLATGAERVPEPAAGLDGEAAAEVAAEADKRAGLCPHGHGLLQRAPVLLDDFYLDRCAACGGLWLDAGEWQRLASLHLLESLPELFTESWQRRQRARLAAAADRDRLEKELGEPLYLRLDELGELLKQHPRRSEALAFLEERSRPGRRGELDDG
ncbi:MAG: zf-TFIIB domain-containing protein [Holophagales bacterium]|nr:zf-TFIIB domain-containing protein [Holophagales bacterium]